MGFGKYFEDNVSIYVGRMIMKSMSVRLPGDQPCSGEKPKVYHCNPHHTHPAKTDIQTVDESIRSGLELRFSHAVDKSTEKKLRLNRWWHKPGENTWFNNNTKTNREFAERFVTKKLARLEVKNQLK